MNIPIKHTGKARSIPGGMAVSGFVSMLITFASSAIIANSLNTAKISWAQAGYWIMGMLFAASFIGGKCAYAVIKRQRIMISVMSGVLYWGLLLCITALFFGGDFDAVWETSGIIGAGCVTAALLSVPNANKRGIKSGRHYR